MTTRDLEWREARAASAAALARPATGASPCTDPALGGNLSDDGLSEWFNVAAERAERAAAGRGQVPVERPGLELGSGQRAANGKRHALANGLPGGHARGNAGGDGREPDLAGEPDLADKEEAEEDEAEEDAVRWFESFSPEGAVLAVRERAIAAAAAAEERFAVKRTAEARASGPPPPPQHGAAVRARLARAALEGASGRALVAEARL